MLRIRYAQMRIAESALPSATDIGEMHWRVRKVPRGDTGSAHIRGTLVPVEEPSTASKADIDQGVARSLGATYPSKVPSRPIRVQAPLVLMFGRCTQ